MYRNFAQCMNMNTSASAAEAHCCASFALLILTGAICLAPVIFILLVSLLIIVGVLVMLAGVRKTRW